MNAVRHFLLSLQFFTRIPLPQTVARWVGYSPAMQQRSLAYFPLVGALVGAAGAVAFAVLMHGLPSVSAAPWVAAVLSTVLTVMLTGAFHEDGLADLADGLGGAVGRERALEIMKDSRLGSYGAVAVALVLLLKTGLLAALGQVDPGLAAWALFAGHAFSRLMPVGVVALFDNARKDADAKSVTTAALAGWHTVWGAVFWAAAMLLVATLFGPGLFWGMGVFVCVLVWLAMCRLLHKRLRGFTGDALGATQQVCEVGFYLGVLLGLPAMGAAA